MSIEENYYREVSLPGAAEVNQLVGNTFNQGWAAADKQLKIIKSEFNELCDGIRDRDLHELRDGIGDVLFTVLGLAHRVGIDAQADYALIVASQFTKFDRTVEDAERTKAKYDAKNMQTHYEARFLPGEEAPYYVTYSSVDQIDDQGRPCSAGKWLKSWQFQEPRFNDLPSNVAVMLPEGVEAMAE